MAFSKSIPSLQFEKRLWQQGFSQVAGIDEVGRGCLAGPVVSAVVIFDLNHQPISGINDSKKLSEKKRLALSVEIKNKSKWFIGWGEVDVINSHGIMPALIDSINVCVANFEVDHLLYDGIYKPELNGLDESQITTIKKGDQVSYSIAAASILAKVARDEYMQKLHDDFPEYDWHNNKGYGTKKHREALVSHGPTKHHRELFIRNVMRKR